MPRVDFAEFPYYPALQSSHGEHIGYRELPDYDKDRLLPIFELSQRTDETNLNAPAADIRTTTAARPFILDLSKDALPLPTMPRNPRNPAEAQARFEQGTEVATRYNQHLAELLNPADGFASWRRLAATFPNAVPTLQFTDPATQARQILRQASLLSRDGQSLAIRFTREHAAAISPVISQIISVLESPDQLLIVVDCGQARRGAEEQAAFAAQSITDILSDMDILEEPMIRAVCMSNSFPNGRHDGLREFENIDWTIWRDARDTFSFMFGDYAAMYRHRRTGFTPFDWRATVVLPLDESWLFYRHDNARDEQGWIDGATAIAGDARFGDAPDIWGTHVIQQAAGGSLEDINSTRFWYASKVNIHIHRQIDFAGNNLASYDDDE